MSWPDPITAATTTNPDAPKAASLFPRAASTAAPLVPPVRLLPPTIARSSTRHNPLRDEYPSSRDRRREPESGRRHSGDERSARGERPRGQSSARRQSQRPGAFAQRRSLWPRQPRPSRRRRIRPPDAHPRPDWRFRTSHGRPWRSSSSRWPSSSPWRFSTSVLSHRPPPKTAASTSVSPAPTPWATTLPTSRRTSPPR